MSIQLRSEIKSNNSLTLSLVHTEIPEPAEDEVVVRIEAAPINPSDLGLLFGPANMNEAILSGITEKPVVTAPVAEALMEAVSSRINQSMAVGNEGAGVVVATGSSECARALMGKVVAAAGGGMYSQHRVLNAKQCMVMPDNVTPAQAASSFVNPLTALAMTETMRAEGHTALVHTAAASNLGQMLNKVCLADGINLVNIVRNPQQVEILRNIGAKYIINSTSDTFHEELLSALLATGATLAFDAIAGGELANDIFSAMEAAANQSASDFSRYGSTTHKQIYMYGGLDRRPSTLKRNYGMAWGIGGWLLTASLQKLGINKTITLQNRVIEEILTTFKSNYDNEISLAQAIHPNTISLYGKQATGKKFLINPSKA